MKTVFFVRHAKSSWKEPDLSDHDRPLNNWGLRDAPFMGRMLAEKGIAPDQLITSTANRARTTAHYFAEAFGIAPEEVRNEVRLYHAYTGDVMALVQGLSDDWNTVFLFGHNPTWTTLANLFSREPVENVPTCGVVRVEAAVEHWVDFEPERGRMTAFYFPKQFFRK